MREASIGLGVVQVMFTLFFAVLLLWLALGVGAAALVLWAIYHLATTYRTPAAVAIPVRPAMSAAAAAAAPAGAVPPQVANTARERTNWNGVAGAVLVAAAAIPYLLGSAVWLTVVLAASGAIIAFVGGNRGGPMSGTTSFALRGASILGAVLAVFALWGMWANRPITLYGENHGDNQGTMLTIAELQEVLPCVEDPTSPAADDQGFWHLESTEFTQTVACRISPADEAVPAVFVQAESAQQLDVLFASGVITANNSDDNEIWVQRDGAVAVITADEDSEELSQNVGATWISMRDKKPTVDDE